MIDLSELDYQDLLLLRDAVNQEISDREFIRNAEQEANNLAMRWHRAKGRAQSDDEIQKWQQPTGAHDSYPLDWPVVEHKGKHWRSLVAGNVHEPGVSGWRQVVTEGEHGDWVQPAGAHDAYKIDETVRHKGKIWKSTHEANVWEPPEQWEEVVDESSPKEPEVPVEPPTEESDYPAWKPWDHVSPLHQIGDRVTHNGKNWESTAGNNHWEPGVYGWKEI